ncbi:very short patch repair endonuclease [Nocardioides carbamazepini]|uniref:very short patch repair endonuclease n=1 Tax=Nocardioides carbamazepini TaxID=2854259 RepID=UPI00214A2DC0|nr:very short patch repair endonuclease [Nocardioides carbamazepini]MCR1785410.1 very short patch repair endonuclease [Nocardioides carbamazepini]
MPGESRWERINVCVSGQGYLTVPTLEPPVSPAARRTMQANRGRDTGPEMAVRSILHRWGLRYRVNLPLPIDRRRRADVVFSRVGLYVFVDGCFWHGCPQHFVMPKTRTAFWREKVEGNRARDRDTDERLRNAGLTPLRIWEHADPETAALLIVDTYSRLLEGRLRLAL